MKIIYDPNKNAKNVAERGLAFDDVVFLEWSQAIVTHDLRKDYTEERFVALLPKDGRLYHVTFTLRDNGQTTRVISFRLAHKKERQHYEKVT